MSEPTRRTSDDMRASHVVDTSGPSSRIRFNTPYPLSRTLRSPPREVQTHSCDPMELLQWRSGKHRGSCPGGSTCPGGPHCSEGASGSGDSPLQQPLFLPETEWEDSLVDSPLYVVHNPRRHQQLPRIERVFNHFLHPDGEAWLIRTTPRKEESNADFYAQRTIPSTLHPEELGEIEWPPGIPLIIRDETANPDGDEKKDIVRGFHNNVDFLVTQENGLSLRDELAEIRDKLVGEEARVDGTTKGGVYIEREGLTANGQGHRCYHTSMSIESNKNILHPCKNARCSTDGMSKEGLALLERLNKVAGAYVSLSYRCGPPNWVRQQMMVSDVMNLPPVGGDCSRGFYSATQLNIAGSASYVDPATRESSGTSSDATSSRTNGRKNTLEDHLGSAGKSHRDRSDHALSLSGMMQLSKLDRSKFHPGLFYLLEYGLFVRLEEFSVLHFSGLHYHGGSSPQPVDDTVTEDDRRKVVRMTYITYPTKKVVEGTVVTVVNGAGTNEKALEYDPSPYRRGKSPALNLAMHSQTFMERESFQRYMSRLFLQMVDKVLQEMPEQMRLHVDSKQFLTAFYHVDKATGDRSSMPDWEYAPGSEWYEQHWTEWSTGIKAQHRAAENIVGPPSSRVLGKRRRDNDIEGAPTEKSNTDTERVHFENENDIQQGTEEDPDSDGDDVIPLSLPPAYHNRTSASVFQRLAYEPVDSSDLVAENTLQGRRLSNIVSISNVPSSQLSSAFFGRSLGVWRDVISDGDMKDLSKRPSMDARVLQAETLITYWKTYLWMMGALACDIRTACSSVNQAERVVLEPWLLSLVKLVRSKASSRSTRPVEFYWRHVFTSTLDSSNRNAVISLKIPRFVTTGSVEESNIVLVAVQSILAQWMGWVSKKDSATAWMSRGMYLSEVIRIGRPELLLLDCVWKAWCDGQWKWSNRDKVSVPIANFASAVERCTENNKSLRTSIPCLRDIVTRLEPYLVHARPSVQTAEVTRNDSTRVQVAKPVRSTRLPNPTNTERTPQANDHTVAHDVRLSVEHTSVDLLQECAKALADFWLEMRLYPESRTKALRWVLESPRTSHSTTTEQERHEENLVDLRLPYRDDAPSRATMLRTSSTDDPHDRQVFCLPTILTRSGLFSAMIFRGVTFRSTVLLKHNLRYFENVDDWKMSVMQVFERREDICSMTAYSRTPITQRKNIEENVLSYWTVAEAWRKQVSDGQGNANKMLFTDAYNSVVQDKKRGLKAPGFGGLVGLLFVEDLVYAGLIHKPTCKEFASIALKMQRGAYKCMRRFGLLQDTAPKPAETSPKSKRRTKREADPNAGSAANVNAFVSLFTATQKMLLDAKDPRAESFDIMIFEHLLCKYGRYEWRSE